MKSKFLLPALTAAIGFTLAWVAKPAGPAAQVVVKSEESAPKRSPRSEGDLRPSPDDSKRPKEVKASDFPLADQAEQGPKSRDEARMLRLKEALGLSIDQESALTGLMEEVLAKADGSVPVIQDLTTRGKMIEEGLAKLLTPEQLVKFQELRERERENRIEARSQKMLVSTIEEIDVSPEQREEILSRLRQKSKADLQSIPAAATLLIDKSILPTNGKELSSDGVLMLVKMDEPPEFAGNAELAHKKVLDTQRQELEENLRCFDGILSAGQMGQYQAALAETREIMKRIPQMAPDPEDESDIPAKPQPPKVGQPEEIPEDEEGMVDDSEEDSP